MARVQNKCAINLFVESEAQRTLETIVRRAILVLFEFYAHHNIKLSCAVGCSRRSEIDQLHPTVCLFIIQSNSNSEQIHKFHRLHLAVCSFPRLLYSRQL